MKIRTLIFICCIAIIGSDVSAQFKKLHSKKEETPKQTVHIVKMDEQVSELMADRVTIRKDIGLRELAEINARMDEAMEKEEDLMFPADELYGSNWDNQWVNPFRGKDKIELPDSCEIDCSSFVLPIDTMTKVTSKYGPRRRRMHRGIDLKVLKGDTIRAAFDGKVRIRSYERRGYGYYLVMRHPNGLETVYGHLSKFLVGVNDIVHAGDPIGLGGNTGRSTGSHLHFEIRFLGQAINPTDVIDFDNAVPHQDTYVFRNVKINGRKSNIYTSSSDQMVYHRVKSGDTLGKIARMYGTTVGELCRLNGIKSTATLRLGQSIRCSAGGGSSVASKSSSKSNAAKSTAATTKKTTTIEAATPEASLTGNVSAELTATSEPVYHRIKSGDTLGALAVKYGTTVSKICEMNGITKTTVLRLGRSIRCK